MEAYRYSLLVFDAIPEPILLVHLHNMLVKKGYNTEPVGLYASFQRLFQTAFFADGKVPTANFAEALEERIVQSHNYLSRTRPALEDVKKLKNTRFFKEKSFLMLCDEAGWNPDRIPDRNVHLPSMLGFYRKSQTKHIVDPITRQRRMEDTDLVSLALLSWALREAGGSSTLEGTHILDAFLKIVAGDLPKLGSKDDSNHDISGETLLRLLKVDISNDICGSVPVSALNYAWVMARFMILFHQFERELSKLRNPVYVGAYETESLWQKQKRVGLICLAFQLQDEECLRVMAREFQKSEARFTDHVYWNDLETTGLGKKKLRSDGKDEELPNHCIVM